LTLVLLIHMNGYYITIVLKSHYVWMLLEQPLEPALEQGQLLKS
jgi:hypothetical protein